MFGHVDEAVVGAASPLAIGDTFQATHGHGVEAEGGDYHPQELKVVGRLPPTGSPWDRAILMPIEHVWQVHGLADGHGGAAGERREAEDGHAGESAEEHAEEEHEHAELRDVAIGPPFDLASMPGIPAAVVKPRTLIEAYGLRNSWRTTETMAFFPAEVLVQLYELLGDVRVVMSALAVATELLLVAAILAGILILMRLYRQRFAVLQSARRIARLHLRRRLDLQLCPDRRRQPARPCHRRRANRHRVGDLREGERHRARGPDRRAGAHARWRHRRARRAVRSGSGRPALSAARRRCAAKCLISCKRPCRPAASDSDAFGKPPPARRRGGADHAQGLRSAGRIRRAVYPGDDIDPQSHLSFKVAERAAPSHDDPTRSEREVRSNE